MTESMQDRPGALDTAEEAEGHYVWMPRSMMAKASEDDLCSPDGGGEVAQTHTPEGLSHWPGMSQLEKAGRGQPGLGLSVSTALLLATSTWHCPDRDPSRDNYLVPLSPSISKTHFPLELLSRCPLPPPLYSFPSHPTILMCWGMGCVVCMVAQVPMGLWPGLKSSPVPPVLQSSPRQTGRSFP